MLKIVSSEALPSVIDTPARKPTWAGSLHAGESPEDDAAGYVALAPRGVVDEGSAAVNEPGRVEEGLATCETLVVAASGCDVALLHRSIAPRGTPTALSFRRRRSGPHVHVW